MSDYPPYSPSWQQGDEGTNIRNENTSNTENSPEIEDVEIINKNVRHDGELVQNIKVIEKVEEEKLIPLAVHAKIEEIKKPITEYYVRNASGQYIGVGVIANPTEEYYVKNENGEYVAVVIVAK